MKTFLITTSHDDGRLKTEKRESSSAYTLREELAAEHPELDEINETFNLSDIKKIGVHGRKYRPDGSGTEKIINAEEI